VGAPAEVAIPNLLATYAERLDGGDYAGVGELFRDAVIRVDEFDLAISGADEAADFYATWTQRYEDTGTLKTKHVTTNLILEVDEDAGSATCRSYVTVFQAVADDFPLQPIYSGRYRDRFARGGDGEWRFAERTIVTDFTGDMSRHGVFPDEGQTP
jgi:hypothetical protein